MRIGELATRSDVSRDTIRFYERHGLIRSEVDPTASNTYRVYSEDAVLTLEIIKDAQSAGLSIADITLFLGQFLAQEDIDGTADAFLDAKIAEVSERVQASERFLDMLRQTKTALARAPQDGLDEVQRGDRTEKPTSS